MHTLLHENPECPPFSLGLLVETSSLPTHRIWRRSDCSHSPLAVSEENCDFNLNFWFCSFHTENRVLQLISDSISNYTEWKDLMYQIKTVNTGLQLKAGGPWCVSEM